jgi:regulator of PEP synthase PpsR (kinase-PPPase family)
MSMNHRETDTQTPDTCTIYVVSGGAGTSGELLVQTVLAQFPELHASVIKAPSIRDEREIEEVLAQAAAAGGVIVHTLVDARLREGLNRAGTERKIPTIDLMGPLLDHLSELSGHRPIGRPGRYRETRQEYFDRVEAIEYTVKHDDGRGTDDLPLADVVLIGVSRCGKTPLSMYLAVHGWKVANVPLIPEIPPPKEVYELDRGRVIGLSIEYEHLMTHRKVRRERMGDLGPSAYTRPSDVYGELESTRKLCRQAGFPLVNVTNKPIETVAEEIVALVPESLKKKFRPS